jgi:CheY-like chemotaxis protein
MCLRIEIRFTYEKGMPIATLLSAESGSEDMANSQRIFEVLLVEDNPADARLMREGWRECDVVESNLHILHDCRTAVPYLQRQNPYETASTPDIILLDYTMPTNGGAALAAIKNHPELKRIPAIVITGSISPMDILDIYERGANCCMTKPRDMPGYFQMVRRIADYWLKSVTLPSRFNDGAHGKNACATISL